MDPLSLIFILGVILFLGYIGRMLFRKVGFPDVIWLLLLGVLIGPVLHIFEPSSLIELSEFVSSLAVILLLFDGGLCLKLRTIANHANEGIVLGIIRFLISLVLVTVVMLAIGYGFLQSVLMGLVLGGVSFAVVVPLTMQLEKLSKGAKTILAIESLMDNFAVVIAFAVMDAITIGSTSMIEILQVIAQRFSTGIVVGAALGIISIPILKKIQIKNIFYIAVLSILLLLYPTMEFIGASGAITVFVFGIVLGNSNRIRKALRQKKMNLDLLPITKPQRILTFFMHTFFFVFLGALLTITDFFYMGVGLVITIILAIVQRVSLRAVQWIGIKIGEYDADVMRYMIPVGLSAAVVTNFIFAHNIPGTDGFIDITFTVILATVIVTAVGVYLVGNKVKKS